MVVKGGRHMKVKAFICLLAIIALTGCSTVSRDVIATVKPQNTGNQIISVDEAKTTAVTHHNLSLEQVTFTKAELNNDDVYTINFMTNDERCYYLINALTNEIVSFNVQPNLNDRITEDKAKEIVLKHAGVKESDVTFSMFETDYENGIYVYEIEFFTSDKKYDYEVKAETGEIISYSCDDKEEYYTLEDNSNVKPTTKITKAEAKEIALKHAKVSSSKISHYKIELDYDDGKAVYEIEFKVGKTEYEYEINATTGKIIKYDIEQHHDNHH